MGSHHPTSLTTSYNEAIGSTIAKVFPQTHHQYCISQILNRCKEILANIYFGCASFQDEFSVCINEPETAEIFESGWEQVLNKYDLDDNLWLQSLYRIRQKWVPVYFKDVFTADLSATQRPESLRNFFQKYFNTRTAYKVTKEDCEATCTVSYDKSGNRAKCYCCNFESSGVLCRHILRVYFALDVHVIPELYILTRWTKEAKHGFVMDECLRYSELHRDALRYAREGSTSGEVFTFAQQTLQVAVAEVVQMKQEISN